MSRSGNPDPRRPEKVQLYNDSSKNTSEPGSDPWAMFGMMLSVSGTFLKYPILSWAALFMLCFSFVNRKYRTQDLLNTATGAIFAVIGLFMAYYAPNVPKA